MAGPMANFTFLSRNTCNTACAMTWLAVWRTTSLPSSSSKVRMRTRSPLPAAVSSCTISVYLGRHRRLCQLFFPMDFARSIALTPSNTRSLLSGKITFIAFRPLYLGLPFFATKARPKRDEHNHPRFHPLLQAEYSLPLGLPDDAGTRLSRNGIRLCSFAAGVSATPPPLAFSIDGMFPVSQTIFLSL